MKKDPPTILSYLRDLPNLCSLAGLACSLLAICFASQSQFFLAMIGMIWAVAFDWADGLIARRIKGRVDEDRAFGAQLDVLIDIVSYGVVPAIILLNYGNFELLSIVAAFLVVAAAALRLSYFSIFGLAGGQHYTGLALDNNTLVIVFLFCFESTLGESIFFPLLTGACMTLAALNVSQIKTPKLSGNPINVFLLAIYTFSITGFYVFKLV